MPRRSAARSTRCSSSARTPAAGWSRTSSRTSSAGPRTPGHHLAEEPAPGYWTAERRDIADTTLDFMHFSIAGASVRDTTGRWLSKKTWDFLTSALSDGAAPDPGRVLSLTGSVGPDGNVTLGEAVEGTGTPDAATREPAPRAGRRERAGRPDDAVRRRQRPRADRQRDVHRRRARADRPSPPSRCASRPSRPPARCGSSATVTCSPRRTRSAVAPAVTVADARAGRARRRPEAHLDRERRRRRHAHLTASRSPTTAAPPGRR